MRKTLLLFAGVLALGALATEVSAQSSGTINVTGSVGKSAAIRWTSWAPINTEAGTNSPAASNSPLDFSLDFSDVAAGNNLADYGGGAVTVILRSNTAYELTAEVTGAPTGFGTVAAGDLALADVGFGIVGLANSGAATKVFGDPAGDATVTNNWDNDPALATKDVDEEPTYTRSLEDLDSGAVTVMSGPRISNRGGRGSPNNGLEVDLSFAVGPQFYTPTTSFDADVELTLLTP